jgi:hypothetical protein
MLLSGKRSLSLVAGALLASLALVFSCEDSSHSAPTGAVPFESGTFDVASPPPTEGGSSTDAGLADVTADAPSDAGAGADVGTPLFTIDAGPDCHPVGSATTLSAAAAGLPAAGLALWLRADHGVYGSTSGAGATEVCAWLDLSGGTTVLASSGPTGRPAWVATGIGGSAAIQFSASTQALVTAGVLGIGATSARTFVAVEKLTSANGRFDPLQQGQGGSPGTYISIDANTWQTLGSLEGSYVTNNSFDTAVATTTANARVHVLTVGSMTVGAPQAGTIDYRIDGQSMPLSLRAGSGNFEDFSGANYTAVGGFGTPSMSGTTTGGLVAEVLVYNRALAASETLAVEAALKARYATP